MLIQWVQWLYKYKKSHLNENCWVNSHLSWKLRLNEYASGQIHYVHLRARQSHANADDTACCTTVPLTQRRGTSTTSVWVAVQQLHWSSHRSSWVVYLVLLWHLPWKGNKWQYESGQTIQSQSSNFQGPDSAPSYTQATTLKLMEVLAWSSAFVWTHKIWDEEQSNILF